eukprot:TRINITY_DN2402_c0_g2_i1.p1 TRINITY_DN2402_c0_g2~~TRINITY_DN2402_c0_g2_i1.p1  ORF type:complete len:604 (-),score=177.31 TRINITY_DN2402_c0_g2_i1:58-1869(-)
MAQQQGQQQPLRSSFTVTEEEPQPPQAAPVRAPQAPDEAEWDALTPERLAAWAARVHSEPQFADAIGSRAVVALVASDADGSMEWKTRSALGELVSAVSRRTRVPSLRADIQRDLRGLALRKLESPGPRPTREQYYPQYQRKACTRDLALLPTEGWGSLEVALWALRNCGSDDLPSFLEEQMARIVTLAATHCSRFVRQVGFSLVQAACERALAARPDAAAAAAARQQLEERLGATGLLAGGASDAWPQVRYAAALAGRAFLDLAPAPAGCNRCTAAWPADYLAALFVSRHDAAEGVRVVAQINWRRAVNMSGRRLLAANAERVVALLERCVRDPEGTHELRQAACAATGELALSVDRTATAPFAQRLAALLAAGAADAHWAVRLAACNAMHDFAGTFPAALLEGGTETGIVPVLIDMLGDAVSGVREAAAAALGACCRNWPAPDALPRLRTLLVTTAGDYLRRVQQEPIPEGLSRDSVFSDSDKLVHDNDPQVHTAQVTFGCCQMDAGEPHDHEHEHEGHEHEHKPWWYTDGAVYLLRELAQRWPEDAAALLPLLDAAAKCQWFPHHQHLSGNIHRQLPRILEGIGKTPAFCKELNLLHPQH